MAPQRLVVMGVSGCGKSTLGAALAEELGWRFVEGDALHPPTNIAKMAAGTPLDDEDRWPYFENVVQALNGTSGGIVISCSALRRSYRDFLRGRSAGVRFVLPRLSSAEVEDRMRSRQGHFMPTKLLESQLATFEEPSADEAVIFVDGMSPLDAQVTAVLGSLKTPKC